MTEEIPIHVSNVSNKLFFVCSYCSRVGDTINILNKCNKCNKSYCFNCLTEANADKICSTNEEHENTYICKICDGFNHKIKCSNCKKDAQDKFCYICLKVICDNCSNEIDCICKEGIVCNNCRCIKSSSSETKKESKDCEKCGTLLCGPKCSKRKCFSCDKGCSVCLVTCEECKKMRCFDCDKSHQYAPCSSCKSVPDKKTTEKCVFCLFCYNSYCKKCLITCVCCMTVACKTCYKNHTANSDACESCNRTLCCNE